MRQVTAVERVIHGKSNQFGAEGHDSAVRSVIILYEPRCSGSRYRERGREKTVIILTEIRNCDFVILDGQYYLHFVIVWETENDFQ